MADRGNTEENCEYFKGNPAWQLNLKGRFTDFLRRMTYAMRPDFSVKMFGGFSLMVLAK